MHKLGLHVGGYVVLLIVIMSVIPLDSSFSSDAGAYGGQVFALRQGDWTLSRPLPTVAEANEGWLNSAITPEGPTPYTANPAYPLLLQGVVSVVHGPFDDDANAGSMALGLHLVPLAGAVVAAIVAWHLAAAWDRRTAPLAFWLLALGPVLVNATTLWAHTLSTALGGLALLLTLRAVAAARHRWPGHRQSIVFNHVGVGALLVGCALVRTESLYWIVAVTITALGAAWLHQSMVLAVASAASGGLATTAWMSGRSWGQSLRADRLPIETSVEALSEPPGWLASRIPAAWQLLLSSLDGGPGPILTLGALGLGVLGALRLRRHRGGPGRHVGLAMLTAAAGLYAARLVLAPDVAISGTLGAWPLLALLPLAVASGHDRTDPTTVLATESANLDTAAAIAGAAESVDPELGVERFRHTGLGPLLIPCALLAVAVLATQYAGSGGLQWGGRYLSLAFAPLAAAAAVHGYETFRRVPVLAGLLVLPAVAGVVASHQLHEVHRHVIDATVEVGAEVVITEFAAVPRIAWTELPTAYYRADDDNVERLLTELARAGVKQVNVHGLAAVHVDGMGGYRQTADVDQVRHLDLAASDDDPDHNNGGVTPSPEALASDP